MRRRGSGESHAPHPCIHPSSESNLNRYRIWILQVWNPEGTLIGKFFLGTTAANLVFAGDGRLVILAETAVYLAEIAAKFSKVSFP